MESKYPPHPAASAFPLMEGEAYERLRDDIKANGLRMPIVLAQHDNQWCVLDGRNRLRACEELGRIARQEYFEGDLGAAIRYSISLNVARRHLNDSQRAYAATLLAGLSQGRPSKTRTSAGIPTQAEAAALLNVSERSVQNAKVVHDRGTPELGAAVQSGEVAVTRAAEIARLEKDQQLDALEQAKNTEAPRTKVERDGMMSIARLMKESEVKSLRVLVEAGEWFAERDARAREGIKAMLSVLPMVRVGGSK
jgi:ParB-like chromosome segregation protein Spo0J